jgi:hypothetical protein
VRFLTIYRASETELPPTTEEMTSMGALIEEMSAAGVLVGFGGCLPSAKGARVRLAGGKLTVTDGPFAESKEVVGGFALLDVPSKEAAIAWTKRFLAVAGDGESEIRQLSEADDAPPDADRAR